MFHITSSPAAEPLAARCIEYYRRRYTSPLPAALQRLAGTTTVQITDMPGIFQNKSEHPTTEMCLENQHGQQCQQPIVAHTAKYLLWSKLNYIRCSAQNENHSYKSDGPWLSHLTPRRQTVKWQFTFMSWHNRMIYCTHVHISVEEWRLWGSGPFGDTRGCSHACVKWVSYTFFPVFWWLLTILLQTDACRWP